MNFWFGTWNLHNRRLQRAPLATLLRCSPARVVALQEVGSGLLADLRAAGVYDQLVSSADVPPAPVSRRPLYCVLGASKPFALADPRQLPLPVPERSLAAELLLHGRRICTVVSVHIPCGVTWKEGKDETFRRLAAWLRQVAEPCVLGIDANSPAVDHPDLTRSEWWRPAEALLHGPEAPHRMRDAFRRYLADHPAQLDQIRQERPAGPLAITHQTGMKVRDNPRRYDFIYVSPQVTIHDVQHHYAEAIAVGSDHALVTARVSVPEWPGRSATDR